VSPIVDRSRVVGYVRVSTDEQAESGVGLAAQRQAPAGMRVGQRTREALAQKRAQGIKLGRPPEIDPATEEFIVTRRRADLPLRAIAQELNTAGVATAGGYAWYVFSTVRRVLSRHEVPPFRAFPPR
jgi:DNA invertase Pin-like site-specific DNA recombinase